MLVLMIGGIASLDDRRFADRSSGIYTHRECSKVAPRSVLEDVLKAEVVE